MGKTVTIQSLLATHNQPFVVIDKSLKIVDVNQSYQNNFAQKSVDLVGKTCCAALDPSIAVSETQCRHQRFFKEVESYAEILNSKLKTGDLNSFKVRGFPLIDGDGVIYLGESITGLESAVRNRGNTRMVGRSSAFRKFTAHLDRSAATDAPVLLTGETGTGKELAAEYIHTNSLRRDKEFVVVDCTVLGEDRFESEVFGHEKGAFTGASTAKTGLFQLADGGTLFLDEIGELPLSQQPKLLRALESGFYRRVGGTKPLLSNVRVICATHRNMPELVDTGEFREDLYYRLSVFPIQLPLLKERQEDIELLTKSILSDIGSTAGVDYKITENALNRLRSYRFPGNIRELRNTLQLAAALSQYGVIDVDEIHLRTEKQDCAKQEGAYLYKFPDRASKAGLSPLENVEARYIHYLLEKHQGNRKRVAFEMSISERTLYRKLKRLNINGKAVVGWS